MDKLKNFKNISDDIMKDIIVTSELKGKTRKKYKRNNFKKVTGILVPAACVVFVVAAVNTLGWFSLDRGAPQKSASEITLMMESAQGLESMPRDNAGSMLKAAPEGKEAVYDTPEEAKKAFGEGFLIPKIIPESFKLITVNGFVNDTGTADRVIFNYLSDKASFIITEEKTKLQLDFTGYEAVDISGAAGYLKTESIKEDSGIESHYTEIHWYKGESHYSVSGQISKDEVIKVAKGME